ncbi:MAG TPA: hypothetical protein VHF47_08395 [Acidimicrobiales bacterium]|nr:hypothetical protein [Acidimicrobiales bacterium]
MSIPLAVGLAAGAVNLWALFDVWRHPRRQWIASGRSRVMWVSLALAGAACGFSTAPFLAPVAVYTAIAYVGVAHPMLRTA